MQERKHTFNKPMIDRDKLICSIEDMATEMEHQLNIDVRDMSRLSTRMILDNVTHGVRGGPKTVTRPKSVKNREEFLVPRPPGQRSWNSVGAYTIMQCVLEAINEKIADETYVWFRIRILCDEFIELRTKKRTKKGEYPSSLRRRFEKPFLSSVFFFEKLILIDAKPRSWHHTVSGDWSASYH